MVEYINVKFNMENIKMALKLLNPGLRPLGTFDLVDGEAGTLTGGEYVELASASTGGATASTDGYAADVGSVGPMEPGGSAALLAPDLLSFEATSCTHENLGGLADEGNSGYGTLFGQLIGANAGRATTVSGSVVLQPTTDRASGKVTVWHQHGLYGVNGTAATGGTDGSGTNALNTTIVANDLVYATTATGLLELSAATGDAIGFFVGAVADSSLVSTTAQAAGGNLAIDHWAVYFCGNAVAPA